MTSKAKAIVIAAFLGLSACGGENAVRETPKATPDEAKRFTEEERSIEQAADEAAKLVEADSISETKSENTDRR